MPGHRRPRGRRDRESQAADGDHLRFHLHLRSRPARRSLDREKVRGVISTMDHDRVDGRFRADRDGVQIGHKLVLFQWQDGKRAIVWPEELAPSQPRFPTPPWSQRP